MKGLTTRILVVTGTVLFSLYLLFPSFLKFQQGVTIPKNPKAGDPWYYSILPSESLKLGLDLMGGLHLVLGIDFNEVMADATTKLKNQIGDLLTSEKITGVTLETTNDRKVLVKSPSEEISKKVDQAIGKDFGTMVDFQGQSGTTLTLGMTSTWEQEVRTRAIDQSLETLRNRIDEFGIAEPIISRQGEDKILVQFPGVSDPGRLKEVIARTAKLTFQIVVSGPEEPGGPPTESELAGWVKEFEKAKGLKPDPNKPMSNYLKALKEYLANRIPKGTDIYFHKTSNINTKEIEYIPYLLQSEALVTGEDLQDAYYSFEQERNTPIVNFQLSPGGAGKFEKATGENVGRFMAIVLDNNVHSAPRIKNKIPGGRAMIEMGSQGRGQDDILKDAKDTSLVLRSGALPARLEFLEERVIGPSLGADAIRSGVLSLIFGLSLVYLFMSVYYRAGGIVACLALTLNGLFTLAVMASFEGTLTLPGLAGLTLTLGMAVDANVLIFEHMREELLNGKSIGMAISEGYSRALSAILDGHITTIIAGVVLLSFGYGPIRGFAVTLLIGLAASLYTSVFVTRVVFDYFVVSKNKASISL